MSDHAHRIVAFEPLPLAACLYRQRMARNNISTATLIEMALGDRQTKADLYLPNDRNLGTATLIRESVHDPIVSSVHVGALDSVASTQPRLDLLKMDVQGSEQSVLVGAKARICADRPIVLMEISGTTRSGFMSLRGLQEALYQDCLILALHTRRNGQYVLTPSDLELTDEQIVCIPKELSGLFEN